MSGRVADSLRGLRLTWAQMGRSERFHVALAVTMSLVTLYEGASCGPAARGCPVTRGPSSLPTLPPSKSSSYQQLTAVAGRRHAARVSSPVGGTEPLPEAIVRDVEIVRCARSEPTARWLWPRVVLPENI
eukprot:361135-Chlamydomonas_euryale.AAC.5